MQVFNERLEEFKRIFKEEYGYEFKSEQEARESAQNLLNYCELLLKISKREYLRNERLKKEPKGFYLEEDGKTYNCIICHKLISGKEGWWDKDGQKCLDCQRMINKKVISKSICKNRESWYADWELQDKFGLHYQTVSKLIRENKLKSRNLKNKQGKIYFRVFLKKENFDLAKY